MERSVQRGILLFGKSEVRVFSEKRNPLFPKLASAICIKHPSDLSRLLPAVCALSGSTHCRAISCVSTLVIRRGVQRGRTRFEKVKFSFLPES